MFTFQLKRWMLKTKSDLTLLTTGRCPRGR